MDAGDFTTWLLEDESRRDQVTHVRRFLPREARYGERRFTLHPRLEAKLERLGLERLFLHQTEAIEAAQRGEDVVVVTGTNSGKTLCYNLPVVDACLSEPACRALYLFPTKALAQDQLGKLEMLLPGADTRVGTYDGDTPVSRRSSLRRMSHVILTNPDMLHIGILPGHEHWSKFLKSLRFIVLDEMHTYRGVFGSHVGNVLRRLLRLCEWHHSRPQIIACSATIGNPEELFGKLTGRKARLILEDGSPKAQRTFVFMNPPLIGGTEHGSANKAAADLLVTMAEHELKSLTFCRARVSAELVLRHARDLAPSRGVDGAAIESYRSGYTPKERRQIEQALFKGQLMALAATNAMELGVDVGGLDAVVLNGYPGSISSFWQQAGRAGRGTREGLAVMIAHDDPLEQFLVREPNLVLGAENENVAANPSNPQILAQQLRCAAYERAIAPSELDAFGPNAADVVEALDRSGELQFRAGRFFYPSHEPPAPSVNIRSSGGDQITLLLDDRELGTMERWRAMQAAHDGAVYLHRGATYVVERLDLEQQTARVTERQVDYFTQALVQSALDPQPNFKDATWGIVPAGLTGIRVTDLVVGYKRKALDGETVLAVVDLEMPESTYDTIAVRLDPRLDDLSEDPMAQTAALHGLEHALMAVAPLMAGCDRGDLGSAWYTVFPDTMTPALFVFDRTPGGVGLCERLFEGLAPWAEAALRLLTSCPCEAGCPACLLSPRCEANNECLDKQGAVRLLRKLAE